MTYPLFSSYYLYLAISIYSRLMWSSWKFKTAFVVTMIVVRNSKIIKKMHLYLPWLRSGEAESCCDFPAPSVQQTSFHQQQAVSGQKSDSIRSRQDYMDLHRPCCRRSGARQWTDLISVMEKWTQAVIFFHHFCLTCETGFFTCGHLSIINISWHKYRH